jgi:MinD superfamily P-loop ATPase
LNLAIASGKGGTGKTTLAVNLARVFGPGTRLLDCDVEEPNAGLFLGGEIEAAEVVTVPVPEVEESLCDGCGECGRMCRYRAIISFGAVPIVFPEMCHGCGGCVRVCPRGAIREVGRRIGVVERVRAGAVTLVQGRLDVGGVLVPPLIRAVRAHGVGPGAVLIDAPPGSSCPVIAAVRGCDYVLLVTEATPFGLHDLTLAVATVRELGLPFGLVINRVGIGDERVQAYALREDIPILLEIPDDRKIAEAYAQGRLIIEACPEYEPLFQGLAAKIRDICGKESAHADL